MSIKWITPAGLLGTIKELDYIDLPISATDSDGAPLEYTKISGDTPPGMYVTTSGSLRGVPTVTATSQSSNVTYTFTVRANNPIGVVSDRTFKLIVSNQSVLSIVPNKLELSAFDDGSLISYQFHATSENSSAKLVWTIISGEAPNDIRTGKPIGLSSTGLFSGYIDRFIDTTGNIAGYDETAEDTLPFDFSAASLDKIYNFRVQVTDGYAYATAPVSISVVSKGSWSADNNLSIINNTNITVDADNKYVPIITTDPSTIPTLQAGDKIAFKFNGFDPEDAAFEWAANGLVNGLTLSKITGWLTGTIPTQVEPTKSYTFTVEAYRTTDNTYRSNPLAVTINTVNDVANYITWSTPTELGTIVNGSISEFKVGATSNLGKTLTYEIVNSTATYINDPGVFQGYRYSGIINKKLPQGLKLLPTGEIVGRATFQYFSLDGDSSKITLASTEGITIGMTAEGPGVASGCKVIAINNAHSVTIKPAVHTTEGSEMTFRNLLNNFQVVTQTTDLSSTTTIDGGKTTFDQSYTFQVKATDDDASATSVKQFVIRVDNYNRAPYENIYLKALPKLDQRKLFDSIISNTDIFPDELIYRAKDAWFGKAKDLKMLFLAGLTTSELSIISSAIQHNHYNKNINFGNVKTARAVDQNFNTIYEVVYLEVTDDKQANRISTTLSQEPNISNPYIYNDSSYTTVYPNSFTNMTYRLSSGVGFNNRGALPNWMTAPQEDGRVLGMTRAVVLAYTIPGASKLIAYRLANNNINFNNIQFVADRYQLDYTLSNNYNTSTNRFYQNKEATFDVLVNTNDIDMFFANVATTVINSNTITLDIPAEVGYGWTVEKYQASMLSVIPAGTIVTRVDGNTITVDKLVSVTAGEQLLINGSAGATYAVTVPFDSVNNRFKQSIPTIDGVKNYQTGETILFIQQEQYNGYDGPHDGWNKALDLFIGDDNTYDEDTFDNYEVVNGYAEKVLDPTVVNQRAGIWQINIDSDGLVSLTFVKEIIIGQNVQITSGTSRAGTFVVYDPSIPSGLTVPTYVPLNAYQGNSTNRTRFDGSGTRFYDHRDNYSDPEIGDKYIIFPQIGVYR